MTMTKIDAPHEVRIHRGMKAIRKDAIKILLKNMKYVNKLNQSQEKNCMTYNIHTYIKHKSLANPNFFRWLFDDYDNINLYGTNLTNAQKEVFKAWIKDL